MMATLLCCFSISALTAESSKHRNQRNMNKESYYNIGLAEADVTPPVGIKLAGFVALTEPSTDIELPLKATALYLEDTSGESFLLLSVEWISFAEKSHPVKERISEATGIPKNNIILCVTHTHAGPVFRVRDEVVKGPIDPEYFNWAMQQLVDCAQKSISTKEPSYVYFAMTQFPLAISRRQIDPSGMASWGPNPDAWVDETLSALSFRRVEDGSLKGIFFSYACHPTSRQTLKIGGDYVGYTFQRLKEHFPEVPTGFLQGFAGDVKPFFVSEDGKSFRQADSGEIDEVAISMANSIKYLVESSDPLQVEGPLSVKFDQIHLPLIRPSRELHQHFRESDLAVSNKWAEHNPYLGEEAPEPAPLPFEVQTATLGTSLAMVFLSGEINVDYSKKIRSLSRGRFSAVIPVGYANRLIAYIPVAEQIPQGGYEVWYANQHSQRPGFLDGRAESFILKCVVDQIMSGAEVE